MKKSFKARIARAMIAALAAVFGFMLSGCGQSFDSIQSIQNITPVAGDFTITGLSAVADGSPKNVSITPKTGKSQGIITVYYEGTSGTVYPRSTIAPSAAGKYAVTFDVEASEGFIEASGLKAGTLIISVKTDNPSDVEDSEDYNEENGLDPGTLTDGGQNDGPVAVEPSASDYLTSGLSAIADGEPKTAIITPKTGKSKGKITVFYEGVDGTIYQKSAAPPSAPGKYSVAFDVDEAEGFSAANGLYAGTLVIVEITEPFIIVDFEDPAWKGNIYSQRTVNWNEYEWTVSGVGTMNANDHYIGARSIRFRGNITSDADNVNRIELLNFLTDGIRVISVNYASYSNHNGGIIELYCQKEGSGWVKAGEATSPAWDNKMQNAVFIVNETGKIRFKIEKINAKGNTSVNIDNIIIYQ